MSTWSKPRKATTHLWEVIDIDGIPHVQDLGTYEYEYAIREVKRKKIHGITLVTSLSVGGTELEGLPRW